MPFNRTEVVAFTVGCVLVLSRPAIGQEYEKPGSIPLAKAAPSGLVEGSRGTIGDPVSNDGMLNTYRVTSPQGEFEVETAHGLCKLVREVNAIQEIAVLEKTEAFSDSAVESAKSLGRGAKAMVTRPGETFKNVGRGIGELFRDVGDRLDRGSERSESEDGSLKSVIGFAKVKREYSHEFRVDVYSNNETLQKYLDQISWAGTSGSIGFKVAAAVATSGLAGAAVSVTGYTVALEDVIRDNTANDLRELTREQLGQQGMDDDLINLFIRNSVLSPRHQVYITGALHTMEGVEGKEHLIRRAANAASYEEGFDRQVQTQMYAHIHAEKPILRFVDIGNDRSVAVAKDGSVVLAAISDHLIWTRNLDGLMQEKNERIAEQGLEGRRQLWLTGTVSDKAREGLEGLGWSVRPGLLEDYADTLCSPAVPTVSLTDE